MVIVKCRKGIMGPGRSGNEEVGRLVLRVARINSGVPLMYILVMEWKWLRIIALDKA